MTNDRGGMMIVQLYEDKATEGKYEGMPNDAHRWWVEFHDGTKRPATPQELELWQLAEGYKDNYQGACKNYWDVYCAGTGKDIKTFSGVDGKTPEDEVRAHRENLEAKARIMAPVFNAAEQVVASDGTYTTEINGVIMVKVGSQAAEMLR